jgi:PAS domain S-box-containing protein
VTKRREAENALRENESVLRTVTNGARVGLVMVNQQRRYLFANRAYAEILGLPNHDIVGKRVAEVLPAVYDQIEPRLARAFRGERVQYELRVPGTTGNQERFYDVIYEPRAHEGSDPYVVVVIVDVTERKHAQQNLEEAVAERTSKLREAVSELEAFSYSIAHDMRAPLRGMQGFAHVLQEDYGERLDGTGQQYLTRIIASAERLDHLIRDVLHYSKVSRGELPLERVNLGVLTREIIESYPQFKDPKVTILIEEPLPTVVGNPASLTQVISNLLSNAVKFVAPGTAPHVRVWSEQLNTSSSGRDSQTVRLWFEDNGIGIPVEAQSRLFQIFQRVHRPEVYEGTGIGLAVVRKAVERLGGKVGVHSEPGKGSRFWLELKNASGNGKSGPDVQVTRSASRASSPPRP